VESDEDCNLDLDGQSLDRDIEELKSKSMTSLSSLGATIALPIPPNRKPKEKEDDQDSTEDDLDSNEDGLDRNEDDQDSNVDDQDSNVDDAAFWIPQATPDGRLFYFNTLTGDSSIELPITPKLEPKGNEKEDNQGSNMNDTDFWIPQATPDGRLFYFNTLTGDSSIELPITPKLEPKGNKNEDDQGSNMNDTDFWIPQATSDGRLFYFNTRTGESSMESQI
jgi:hypothetical protein